LELPAFYQYAIFEKTRDLTTNRFSQVVLRSQNGFPLLITSRVDQGNLMVLATSLDRDWNDWPIRTSYLPFVHQAINFLSNTQSQPNQSSIQVGSNLILSHKQYDKRRFALVDPKGKTRWIKLTSKQPENIKLNQPGIYRLEYRPTRKNPADIFVANQAQKESELPFSSTKLGEGRMKNEIAATVADTSSMGRIQMLSGEFILLIIMLLLGESVILWRM